MVFKIILVQDFMYKPGKTVPVILRLGIGKGDIPVEIVVRIRSIPGEKFSVRSRDGHIVTRLETNTTPPQADGVLH
jgi:hypothetical protein